MNDADIEAALKGHIDAAYLVWPIAWGNINGPEVAPFLTVELVPTERTDDTLDGVGLIQRGFLMVKAVINEGIGEATANRKADEVLALFPRGLRIPTADGHTVSIYRHPEPLQGFKMEQKWHKPVRVHFEVF